MKQREELKKHLTNCTNLYTILNSKKFKDKFLASGNDEMEKAYVN